MTRLAHRFSPSLHMAWDCRRYHPIDETRYQQLMNLRLRFPLSVPAERSADLLVNRRRVGPRSN